MLIVEHLKLVKKTSQKRELGPSILFFKNYCKLASTVCIEMIQVETPKVSSKEKLLSNNEICYYFLSVEFIMYTSLYYL